MAAVILGGDGGMAGAVHDYLKEERDKIGRVKLKREELKKEGDEEGDLLKRHFVVGTLRPAFAPKKI
jgi:hypothetical protein